MIVGDVEVCSSDDESKNGLPGLFEKKVCAKKIRGAKKKVLLQMLLMRQVDYEDYWLCKC